MTYWTEFKKKIMIKFAMKLRIKFFIFPKRNINQFTSELMQLSSNKIKPYL